MTTLPPTTKSRLQKIPLSSVVWEGDRRPLGNLASHLDGVKGTDEDCIIWVDGSEGAVRSMDVVTPDMGLEAIVRTLLRAIESPHHPAQPQRPQKIVVRDREVQFFLRGVLQDLDINVEYASQLPLIDRLFEGFSLLEDSPQPPIPECYQQALENLADQLWEEAPWKVLADCDILQVELEECEIERVFLSVMGMMSAEYGVLMYRSLESLQQFRAAAMLKYKTPLELEKAFLAQDCWFLNYEKSPGQKSQPEMYPFFGSLHPFEGMRHCLDEAETKIVYAALESLLLLSQEHKAALKQEPIGAVSKAHQVTLVDSAEHKEQISTKISTMPELTTELLEMSSEDSPESQSANANIPIQEDLIPEGALISLASIPKNLVKQLHRQAKTYCQTNSSSLPSSELPTIFIQTTRPKAKTLITRIRNAGGLKAVCFNQGHDPFSGEVFDLGMLQTQDDELYIFAEYSQEVSKQALAVEKWHKRCQKTKGFCLVVVAMGATGNNRGKPQSKDMLALFEIKSINGAELGMGVLQLMPNIDI